jgi:hypothetical protein
VQPRDGALDQRREILPAPRQRQGFGEERQRIGMHHAVDQCLCVLPRGLRQGRGYFRCPARIEHVAAGGLDKQRFLCSEIIGDLARKGVRGCSDVSDGHASEATVLEQAACRIEQARAHLTTCLTRRADRMAGLFRRPVILVHRHAPACPQTCAAWNRGDPRNGAATMDRGSISLFV